MNPTRRALVRLTFPAAIVGLYTACDELTVDETTQVDQIQVQVGCRDGDGDFPGLKSCTMSVGEVDTLQLTFLLDSSSVTGVRVSWTVDDPSALAIRTLQQVLDADSTRSIDSLSPQERLGLQLRAEVVARRRGVYYVEFAIDSAGFFADDDERIAFNRYIRDSFEWAISIDERWQTVTAGRNHTCALTYRDADTLYPLEFNTSLRPGGEAFCWGDGPNGALGTGSFTETEPFSVATDERFSVVAAGREHSCALNLRTFMLCWGGNEEGRLGTGDDLDQFAPRRLALGIPFTFPALGNEFSCGVPTGRGVDSGLVLPATCWGRNGEGQLGCDDGTPAEPCHYEDVFNTGDQLLPGEDVTNATDDILFKTIAAGGRHACGIEDMFAGDGPTWCWGDNTFGQLGVASTPSCATVEVASFPCSRVAVPVEGPALTFVQIDAGQEFTCGLTDITSGTGEIYCWGRNSQGQLGNGSLVDTSLPVRVTDDFTATGFRAVTTGGSHACGLTPEGTAYCWGSNSDGQLGDGTNAASAEPVEVAGDLSFLMIAAGERHTCGVVNAPVSTLSDASVITLAVGGPIYCWGDNEPIGDDDLLLGGKLGNGGFQDSWVPMRISEPLDRFF